MEMRFGEYLAVKDSKTFFGVYDCSSGKRSLITHRNNWRQATKLAKLLDAAYKSGYDSARDIYCDYYIR
jgi:hypothetical protein